MDSGMIGKIEKAKQYAQERERFHFESSHSLNRRRQQSSSHLPCRREMEL